MSDPTPAAGPPAQSPQGSPRHSGQGPSGPRANFGQRLLALIVDGVILAIVQLLLQALFGRSANLLSALAGLAYYVYLEGSPSGQTVGKKLLNIRIVDFQTGGPLGFGKAAIRYVGRIVSGIPCGLGYFWMLWDKERQTWHDKFATSVVVPTADYPVEKWPG
ncbi:MAG: RDD family protein [Actinomycetota bacterium]|nr:RDD family protein [Actinomycetota bacterium]